MFKRSLLILLAVVSLTAVLTSLALAQTVTPVTFDQGVRGTGTIAVSNTSVGRFDINVGRIGSIIGGGFTFAVTSMSATTGSALITTAIQSAQITGLDIKGNSASITAIGYMNKILCDLQVQVLDDNASGDWFRIVASPKYLMIPSVIFAGGVKTGDISVYTNLKPDVFAKGDGAIAVNKNAGVFKFSATRVKNVSQGSISYVEQSPLAAAPRVIIKVSSVDNLDVVGNTAVLTGKGTLNGVPAMVSVKVMDNSMLATIRPTPDMFSITAIPVAGRATDPTIARGYSASGPVVKGDISVGRLATTTN